MATDVAAQSPVEDWSVGLIAVGVFFLVLSLVGFILGWIAWSKATNNGGSKLFGPTNGFMHILGAFMWSPVEVVLGSIEIHRQNNSGGG